MQGRFQVDYTVLIWLAFAVLILPFSWMLAAASAVIFHELCHIAVARLFGLSWSRVTADAKGMVIYMGDMSRWETVLVTAAGPLGSFALLLLLRIWPQLAVCGFVQGIYNLLPVYPLDGGRILYCFMGIKARWVEGIVVFCILIGGICLSFYTQMGINTLIISVMVAVRAIQRKFPCKAAKLRVQ